MIAHTLRLSFPNDLNINIGGIVVCIRGDTHTHVATDNARRMDVTGVGIFSNDVYGVCEKIRYVCLPPIQNTDITTPDRQNDFRKNRNFCQFLSNGNFSYIIILVK